MTNTIEGITKGGNNPLMTGFVPSVVNLDLTIAAGTVDGRTITTDTFTIVPPGSGTNQYGVYINSSDDLFVHDEGVLDASSSDIPAHIAKVGWFLVTFGDTVLDENTLTHFKTRLP